MKTNPFIMSNKFTLYIALTFFVCGCSKSSSFQMMGSGSQSSNEDYIEPTNLMEKRILELENLTADCVELVNRNMAKNMAKSNARIEQIDGNVEQINVAIKGIKEEDKREREKLEARFITMENKLQEEMHKMNRRMQASKKPDKPSRLEQFANNFDMQYEALYKQEEEALENKENRKCKRESASG